MIPVVGAQHDRSEAPVRVILVGSAGDGWPAAASGAGGASRGEERAGSTLRSVRDVFDAFGALAALADEPGDVLVVLPSARGLGRAWGPGDVARVVQALRRVDSRVVVALISESAGAGSEDGHLPGVMRVRAGPASWGEVRELLAAALEEPEEPGEPAVVSAPPVAEWRGAAAGADADTAAELLDADAKILSALERGGDVLGPMLDRIRPLLKQTGGRFVGWSGAEGAGPQTPPGCGAWEVRHRERTLAWLVGPSEASRVYEAMAAWMGSWIALRDQHVQFKSEAFTDPLTGAWNRRYFTRFLASCIDRARERRGDVTLLLFDIDNFKAFNDAFGHREGDEILTQTVRLLNSVIRPTDRVCRMGGDELAVVFDDPAGPRDPRSSHPSSIFEIARRFQRQVLEAGFASLAGNAPGRLTVSGGLATFPWDGPDAQTLLDRADERLLESKRLGKNAICFGPRAGDVLHAEDPRGGGRS